MATDQLALPSGFVLDELRPTAKRPSSTASSRNELPTGFVLDEKDATPTPPSRSLVSRLLPPMSPLQLAFTPEAKEFGRTITDYGASIGRKAGDVVESAQNALIGAPRPQINPPGVYPRVKTPSDLSITARSILPSIAESIPTVTSGFLTPEALATSATLGPALGVASKSRLANTPLRIPFTRKPLEQVINTGISKAIRPSVAGKGTASQTQRYYDQARQAVHAIASNRANLQLTDDAGQPVQKLPESLREFSHAIEQTKDAVFQQYNALVTQAGQQRVTVNLAPIASEVQKAVSNRAIKTLYPDVQKYGLVKAKAMRKTAKFTPEEAQDAIKLLNKSLEAYYKNPSPETGSRAVIDAGIANNLRKALDEAIEKATGTAYQPLKSQYAALKAIERDVNRRAVVAGRQNAKGLIDFTDILSGGNIVRGLLRLNPADFAAGVAQKGIANYLKAMNNPDRIVRKMFQAVGKSQQRLLP